MTSGIFHTAAHSAEWEWEVDSNCGFGDSRTLSCAQIRCSPTFHGETIIVMEG